MPQDVLSVSLGQGTMVQGPPADSSGSRFTPLVVLELASDTNQDAIAWLLSRIRDQQQDGGVEGLISPPLF